MNVAMPKALTPTEAAIDRVNTLASLARDSLRREKKTGYQVMEPSQLIEAIRRNVDKAHWVHVVAYAAMLAENGVLDVPRAKVSHRDPNAPVDDLASISDQLAEMKAERDAWRRQADLLAASLSSGMQYYAAG